MNGWIVGTLSGIAYIIFMVFLVKMVKRRHNK
jgi:uncharacterized membrane protein YtjA (UPF0391 family)